MLFWQCRGSILPKCVAGWQAGLSVDMSLPTGSCRGHLESKYLGVGVVVSPLWEGGRITQRRDEFPEMQ